MATRQVSLQWTHNSHISHTSHPMRWSICQYYQPTRELSSWAAINDAERMTVKLSGDLVRRDRAEKMKVSRAKKKDTKQSIRVSQEVCRILSGFLYATVVNLFDGLVVDFARDFAQILHTTLYYL